MYSRWAARMVLTGFFAVAWVFFPHGPGLVPDVAFAEGQASPPQTGTSPPASLLPSAPVTAKAQMLVICAAFRGKPQTKPLSTFANLYFGIGNRFGIGNSVASYFRTVSYGVFSLTGQVVGDPASPGRFLTLPHPESYYAGKDNGSGSPYPHNDDGLVEDALKALERSDFNFAPYVAHGQIPYLTVVYTGYGADVSPGDAGLVWPVESGLQQPFSVSWTGPAGQRRTAVVTNYDLVPELNGPSGQTTTLGVPTHEFGHLLGLDDLYDTSTSPSAGQGVGPWSLMGDGNWNGFPPGSSPAELDPFSRIYLGWVRPQVVTESVTGLRLPPLELRPSVLELRPAGNFGEYFLVSNEQRIGLDAALPESGVLIWRIDANEAVASSPDWQNDTLNSPSQNQGRHNDIAILEAGDAGDLNQPYGSVSGYNDTYPDPQGNNRLTAHSKPGNLLWNGSPLGIDLTQIAVGPTGVATLDIRDAQTGASLVINRPAAGLRFSVGSSVRLTATWSAGGSSYDVSAEAGFNRISGPGMLRGRELTFTGPGMVVVSAYYRGLGALIDLRAAPSALAAPPPAGSPGGGRVIQGRNRRFS